MAAPRPRPQARPPAPPKPPAAAAATVAPGYYAKEPFRTMYQGITLEFKLGQQIEDENIGEFLLNTGSPVEHREG